MQTEQISPLQAEYGVHFCGFFHLSLGFKCIVPVTDMLHWIRISG